MARDSALCCGVVFHGLFSCTNFSASYSGSMWRTYMSNVDVIRCRRIGACSEPRAARLVSRAAHEKLCFCLYTVISPEARVALAVGKRCTACGKERLSAVEGYGSPRRYCTETMVHGCSIRAGTLAGMKLVCRASPGGACSNGSPGAGVSPVASSSIAPIAAGSSSVHAKSVR